MLITPGVRKLLCTTLENRQPSRPSVHMMVYYARRRQGGLDHVARCLLRYHLLLHNPPPGHIHTHSSPNSCRIHLLRWQAVDQDIAHCLPMQHFTGPHPKYLRDVRVTFDMWILPLHDHAHIMFQLGVRERRRTRVQEARGWREEDQGTGGEGMEGGGPGYRRRGDGGRRTRVQEARGWREEGQGIGGEGMEGGGPGYRRRGDGGRRARVQEVRGWREEDQGIGGEGMEGGGPGYRRRGDGGRRTRVQEARGWREEGQGTGGEGMEGGGQGYRRLGDGGRRTRVQEARGWREEGQGIGGEGMEGGGPQGTGGEGMEGGGPGYRRRGDGGRRTARDGQSQGDWVPANGQGLQLSAGGMFGVPL